MTTSQGDGFACFVRMTCIGGVDFDSRVWHEKVNEPWMAKTLVTRPFENPRRLFMRSDHPFHYSCTHFTNTYICIMSYISVQENDSTDMHCRYSSFLLVSSRAKPGLHHPVDGAIISSHI